MFLHKLILVEVLLELGTGVKQLNLLVGSLGHEVLDDGEADLEQPAQLNDADHSHALRVVVLGDMHEVLHELQVLVRSLDSMSV